MENGLLNLLDPIDWLVANQHIADGLLDSVLLLLDQLDLLAAGLYLLGVLLGFLYNSRNETNRDIVLHSNIFMEMIWLI